MSSPLSEARAASPPDARAIERFVTRALDEALAERAIAVVRVPAPLAPIDAPLRAARRSTSIAWLPPSGAPLSAVGHAAEIVLRGADRFAALERGARALFASTLRRAHPDVRDAAPRVFGGWAFAAGGADEEPWDGFGDGRFVLPRWTYEHDGGRGVLTLALDLRDGWAGRVALARSELAAITEALARPRGLGAPGGAHTASSDRGAWRALVGSILDAVRAGRLEKAVATRIVEVRATHDLDAWSILHRLSARYPSTFAFALRFSGACFLGATPERLFEKRGRNVVTEALAGSIAAHPGAERALRESDKDRREHGAVVRHVLERLAPLCEPLTAPEAPSIRRLPNVLHLHTPLRGTLRPGVSAAALVEALHPTPAVGGLPSRAALAHLEEHEAHARGWYTGPVGWLDADGDADFVVALRCGLVRGASAWLYAGGGIVDGSEPDAEWEESELKLRPLLDALGGAR